MGVIVTPAAVFFMLLRVPLGDAGTCRFTSPVTVAAGLPDSMAFITCHVADCQHVHTIFGYVALVVVSRFLRSSYLETVATDCLVASVAP